MALLTPLFWISPCLVSDVFHHLFAVPENLQVHFLLDAKIQRKSRCYQKNDNFGSQRFDTVSEKKHQQNSQCWAVWKEKQDVSNDLFKRCHWQLPCMVFKLAIYELKHQRIIPDFWGFVNKGV